MSEVVPLTNYFAKSRKSQSTFAYYLKEYTLTDTEMVDMGYPMESKWRKGLVEIQQRYSWYRPGGYKYFRARKNNMERVVKDLSAVRDRVWIPEIGDCYERSCERCWRPFYTTTDMYIKADPCHHHSTNYYTERGKSQYWCCGGGIGSKGCTEAAAHVWNGLVSGTNGLYDDYIFTKPRSTPSAYLYNNNGGNAYAVDCEMCYTAAGLEATKVTLVNMDGRPVYDTYIRPDRMIVDYATHFSGITAKHLEGDSVKTLRRVQQDLMELIDADTVLIGHGLDADLRVLKIVHSTVVDTAKTFTHRYGLPYRRSLQSITSEVLGREIQCGDSGHDSYEDAAACMELMLWRVRQDYFVVDLPD